MQKQLDTLLDNNIYLSDTPDIAALRYAGDQYVFIWDTMKHLHCMEALGLRQAVDFKCTAYHATTVEKFTPFKFNKADNQKADHFLPVIPDWPRLVSDGQTAGIKKPEHVCGKIYHVNLRALQKIDRYYQNNCITKRIKLKVFYTSAMIEQESTPVWAYVCGVNSFSKYNPHTQKYNFVGNLPLPIPVTYAGGIPRYDVGYQHQVYKQVG